jgi:8-oxo-dGTP pyrophosphatase MutT (NUDIX family)
MWQSAVVRNDLQTPNDGAALTIPHRLTAFACTVDAAGQVLMVRHERLGVVRWELPGGHVDPGETSVAAARRETAEEAHVDIEIEHMIAECRHRWGGRSVGILYYLAHPVIDGPERHGGSFESGIHAVEWIHPGELIEQKTSALAWPVISLIANDEDMPGKPLLFEATHRHTDEGWQPIVTRSWRRATECV